MKKSIGIEGVKAPEKECQDAKCAWHGKTALRGRVVRGIVKSSRSQQTVVVGWDYTRFVKKYESYERRKSHISAHNPPCIHAREGDRVVVVECRPLSKTKAFVVVGKETS